MPTSQPWSMANNLLSLYLVVSSLSLVIPCNADASKGNHEFSYEEESPHGPKKWGSLGTDSKSCSDGESQSPINIEVKNVKFQPSDLKMSYKEAPAKVFNRGHTIMVAWLGDAGGIEVNGSTYKLVQCHWHTPSEHVFDGERYDAEIHFVHSNDKDQKAVIGVLYTIGESDPFIEKLESKFKEINTNGNDLGEVSAGSSTSGSKKYFRYKGSLTTPPCSEGVTWTLAETVKSISKDQLDLLKGPLDPEFKENARPIQDLSGREIMQFEDKEGSGEESRHSGTESFSSILQLRNGIIILIQMYILFLI